MKEKDGFVNCPEQQMILYVEKEDGKFGPMQTGSYLTANFLDDYLLKRRNLEASLREKVLNGEISPIRYFLVLEDMTISDVSSRTGLSGKKVKKHLDPAGFGSITVNELNRYARVFNIPPANLLQMILVKTGGHLESLTITENKTGSLSVSQAPSGNPYVVLTKVEERNK